MMTSAAGQSHQCRVKEVVKEAISDGYRHVDRVYDYMNKGVVGEGIREMIDGAVKREELFIVNKAGYASITRIRPIVILSFFYGLFVQGTQFPHKFMLCSCCELWCTFHERHLVMQCCEKTFSDLKMDYTDHRPSDVLANGFQGERRGRLIIEIK